MIVNICLSVSSFNHVHEAHHQKNLYEVNALSLNFINSKFCVLAKKSLPQQEIIIKNFSANFSSSRKSCILSIFSNSLA